MLQASREFRMAEKKDAPLLTPTLLKAARGLLSMDQAVRNLVDTTGCDLAAALRCASAYPAELLGRHDLGHLRPGALADLVLIDADLTVAATVIAGRVVYDRDGRYCR